MTKLFAVMTALVMVLGLLVGCTERGNRDTPSVAESILSESQNISSEPIAPSDSDMASPPGKAVENSEVDDTAIETASFSLGYDCDAQEMTVGDSIGNWTLANLQITYCDDWRLNMLETFFEGDVTLAGTLSRSALMDDGFDFRVAIEDAGKMPCYVASEMTPKDEIWMMLDIPNTIADTLNIESEVECEIIISDYRFIFAYMMAPASATVVDVLLPEEILLPHDKLQGYLDAMWGYRDTTHKLDFEGLIELGDIEFYTFGVYSIEGEYSRSFAIAVDERLVYVSDEQSEGWIEDKNPEPWSGW